MNLHLVEGSDEAARRAFSADDLRRMVETGILAPEEPVELIEGELVVMNAQGFAHERIKTALARKLGRFLPENVFVAAEVSVQLSTRSIVQSDLLVGPDNAVTRTAEGFLTIPASELLLVVEVSVSTLSFDRGRKAALYAQEAIPEYWIIDVRKSRVRLHRDPSPEGYRSVIPAAADAELRPAAGDLAGFAIALADLA